MTLEMVEESSIEPEDMIACCLIDRPNHPLNSKMYDGSASLILGFAGSLAESLAKEINGRGRVFTVN